MRCFAELAVEQPEKTRGRHDDQAIQLISCAGRLYLRRELSRKYRGFVLLWVGSWRHRMTASTNTVEAPSRRIACKLTVTGATQGMYKVCMFLERIPSPYGDEDPSACAVGHNEPSCFHDYS